MLTMSNLTKLRPRVAAVVFFLQSKGYLSLFNRLKFLDVQKLLHVVEVDHYKPMFSFGLVGVEQNQDVELASNLL